jgi:hypothetical protein
MISNITGLSKFHNAYVSTANVCLWLLYNDISTAEIKLAFTLHNLAIWTTSMKSHCICQGLSGVDDSYYSLLQEKVLTEH